MARPSRGLKQRFNLYLSDQQIEGLDKLAVDTQLTMAEHVRRAIDEYLEKLRQRGQLDDYRRGSG